MRNVFAAIALLCVPSAILADDGIDFFESRIRPVLVERCYECHNASDTAEADLALDSRDGIRSQSEHGHAIVPGKPEESLLLKVLRHEISDLEMPEGGPKLEPHVIADFERWIAMGAPDPRNEPPTIDELRAATSWEKTLEKRKAWWSFQPIQNPTPPSHASSSHPIDQFIRSNLAEQQLPWADQADRRTLIRRLAFALTGLPPSQEEIERFLHDPSDKAFDKLVERYLDSPQFGERWARHWMDLFRYTDSHGSEGDPRIPHAYQYRDYVIRALNQDVPYDQLVREHLAGDLLKEPRVNEELGINESAIGPAHFRFVFHGFAPTDALDEKVRFTDDQINVVSKALLGLTVSCARCHDHKFDAISQTDYYAMFGIFASCRPALRDVNLPERKTASRQSIQQLKKQLRPQLVQDWARATEQIAQQLLEPDDAFKQQISDAKQPQQILNFWQRLTQRQEGASLEDAWKELRQQWQQQRGVTEQPDQVKQWDLSSEEDYEQWFAYGNGMPPRPTGPGEFAINHDGNVVQAIFPAGVITHSISQRHRGFLASPRFKLDDEWDAWLLVAGGGQPSIRYAVENYPRNGTVYPVPTINKDHFYWQQLKLKYWTGDYVHFEVATSRDAPLQNRNQDRSWFAIRDVVMRKSGSPGPPDISLEYLSPIFEAQPEAPRSIEAAAGLIQEQLVLAIQGWQADSLTDQQALLLNAGLALLPNTLDELSHAKPTVEALRKLESDIPDPFRVPGVVEADPFDQPRFDRGDHRRPAEPVQRRFLEAIDARPYQTQSSGRLELAESILHPDNPLASRVIANRIWHYLFGQGIVSTPDNFGRLGGQPSHPELLDYLAQRFGQHGWSIKEAIRFVVTSETWQAMSTPSTAALQRDPENRLLSHAPVLRLDAESIRDSLLAVSGQLDRQMFGEGFAANSRVLRRSVYVTARRNSLDEFLKTFDAPTPFATTGRRAVTNVPAQSLTLLNDPFVIELAKSWAKSTDSMATRDRITNMISTAFGRETSAAELRVFEEYVTELQAEFGSQDRRRSELAKQVTETRTSIDSILAPAREQVLREQSDSERPSGPEPIAAWDFENNLNDSVGALHGKSYGEAKIEDGALVLDGDSYVATTSLQQNLQAKSLEAWVQLSTLDQGGGGVITVQSLDGVLFDSIVFAERQPKRWMAGSNGFVRTEDFNGEEEDSAHQEVTHIAITYQQDGTLQCYRNGKPYGKATRKAALQTYTEQNAQVLFGMRHGEVGVDDKGRKLQGRVFAARMYDRALTAEEVMASASGQSYVSEKMLLEVLTDGQRDKLVVLRDQLAEHEHNLSHLPEARGPEEAWARLAHAIFNLKEFIYLK